MGVSTNIDAFVRSLNLLPEQFKEGAEEGLDQLAEVGKNAIQRNARRTYARPVRRSSTGRPEWERSGNLASNQDVISRPGERELTTTGPAADYEGFVANLRTGPDGINRSNDIKGDAYKTIEPQAAPIIQQAIANKVGR